MKKSTTLIVCILFFQTISLFSQSSLQGLIQQGINKVYNMEFDSAEKTFDRMIELYPEQPHGYFYTAQLHFWLFLGTRDIGEYYTFLKFAEISQQKIDKLIEENKGTERIHNLAGNLASYRAMSSAVNNSPVDALWSSKKALDNFEKALEINPRFYNAYFGLGLLDYAMSFVPDFLRWAVNLSGLSSDKQRGLRYLNTAYKRGTSDKTEIAFHLSRIYADYLADYDSSYFYIRQLINTHPKNTLFHYQYAVFLIKDKKLDAAINPLNTVIRINNKRFSQITALAHYRKGEISFKKNQFADAIKHYKIFLEESNELDFTGLASYNIALSSMLLDDDDGYKEFIQLAREGNKDIFEDSYAKERSERFISQGINKNDLFLIRVKNYLDAGNYKTVYDSLKSRIDEFQGEQKALALLYFGESALRKRKLAEASDALDNLRKINVRNEKWITPYSYLIEALTNFQAGEKERAKELLMIAEDTNSYEFRDNIQARIENLKRKLH